MLAEVENTETRKCQACRRPFTARKGSLVKLCRSEECVNERRTRMRATAAQAQRERARIETLRQDTEIRRFWPEIEDAAQLAARLDHPDRRGLGNACRQVARARGRDATHRALIEVAAVALRWAGIISKRGAMTSREHEAA